MVIGVDTLGRMLFHDATEGYRLWTPAGSFVPVTGIGARSHVTGVWRDGLVYNGQGADLLEAPAVFGSVDESGVFLERGQMPTVAAGMWSADGSRYAYAGEADGTATLKQPGRHLWIKDADTGERRKLGMPSGRLVELVAWDGPDTVVLQVRNPYGEDPPGGQAMGLVALVGCDVLTGDCHEVDGSPTGPAELPSVW